MSYIITVSMPKEIYFDIVKRQETNKSGWGWSHIFKVGYMKLAQNAEPDTNVLKLQRANDFLNREIQELQKKLDIYRAEMR